MGSVKGSQGFIFMCFFLAGLVSHNLATTVEDKKNYYSPHPGSRTPPHKSSHRSPTPSHGSGGGHTSTPSPPTYASNPPSGGYTPTPSTPSNPGNCGTPPPVPTPSTPTYYSPPPTPTTPTPVETPPTPVYVTPPTPFTPISPSIPSTPPPEPDSPFSFYYWKDHPEMIWGLFGWWGTLGSAFGVSSLPGLDATMSLPQALSNTRSDGYGLLYREGTASLLNSMVNNKFPFTTNQVRDSFVSALASTKAAADQGQVFKMANEGMLKPRA